MMMMLHKYPGGEEEIINSNYIIRAHRIGDRTYLVMDEYDSDTNCKGDEFYFNHTEAVTERLVEIEHKAGYGY